MNYAQKKANNFSLQANCRTHEGREAQLQYINKTVNAFQKDKPVISVDAKKREPADNFKNTEQE